MKHPAQLLLKTCSAAVMMAGAPFLHAQPAAPAPNPVDSSGSLSTDDVSYLFGLTFGEQLHNVGVQEPLSMDALSRGFKEGLQGKVSTPAQQQQLQEYVHTAMRAGVKRNQTAAGEFLERNSHEKGVTTTASGLQYKVLAAGDRKAPPILATDEVTVQYRGKLLDGSEFDSSYSRGSPATFKANRVIKGWQEALVLMKPGAKWQLFVPPALGYDQMPKPGIPAGSLLIFDVEVVSAKSGAAPAAVAPAPPPTTH